MKHLISIVILVIVIAIVVLWTQLILCCIVWNLAENLSEINHRYKATQISKQLSEKKHDTKKVGK